MKKKYNIAVIGATGKVGRETINILAERKFPINNLFGAASSGSIGKEISFGDAILKISGLETLNFSEIDIAFFSAGSEISKRYAHLAANDKCVVIDKSSYFRLNPDVPLIVPEVNISSLKNYKKMNIVANPNCCTTPLAVVLKPLDNATKIKRVIISTFQSASGAGTAGMDELYSLTKAKYILESKSPLIFPRPIAFNIIPHIGDFNEDGSTSEESKIAAELEKILGSHIKTSVTCTRVPVFIGHSMAVNIEFEDILEAKEIEEILQEADGIFVLSNHSQQKYNTPIEVVGEDFVYVSRIRKDNSRDNSINLWITVDNIRKGAALNSVQIAENLINEFL